MKLLVDHELRKLVDPVSGEKVIHNVPDVSVYEKFDWESSKSTVQPSSVDLHVGSIVFPGVEMGEAGSISAPKTTGQLEPGETAIVTTHERIELPADMAGIGFPPTSVSARGVLMTNPGHVDPGFNGHLQFTLINMGKDRYCLNEQQSIVTLLLFELDGPGATHCYTARNGSSPRIGPTERDVDRLAPDFFDFKKRSETIARDVSKEAVSRAEAAAAKAREVDVEAKSRERIITVFGSVAAAILAVLVTVMGTIQGCKTSTLSDKIKALESNLKTDERLKELESSSALDDRVTNLEARPVLVKRVQELERKETLQDEVRQLKEMLKTEASLIRTEGASEDSKLRQEIKELRQVLGQSQNKSSDPPAPTKAPRTQ